jgi:uncharacterized alpha-E superfamily protein
LLDEANPRSAAFQLAAIENHLRELPRITLAQRSDVPGGIAAEARKAIAVISLAQLARWEKGTRPELGELTDTVRADMGTLSDAIADAYFQHASRRRTGGARRGPA